MDRRSVLASVATGAAVAGCLSDIPNSGESGGETEFDGNRSDSDGGVRSSLPKEPSPDECGVATEPLSALLTDETGDSSYCFDGATPGLAVENERDEPVSVTVAVESFEGEYELDSGERIVERAAFEAADDLDATVTVGNEEYARTWADRSCYRHGIAITDDGVEVGRIEPLAGPGDTQHDCYAGSEIGLWITASGESRTATIPIDDLCAGTRTTETVEVNDRTRVEDALVSGGVYDVTIDVHDGDTETYEFREGCWGVDATIEADGSVRIQQLAID